MKSLKFHILDENFTVYRLKTNASIPKIVFSSPFYSISKSDNELSIVAVESTDIECEASEPGWSALRVEGTLDFGEIGILAGIANTLAAENISIFAISTFETDIILVKKELLKDAKTALSAAGHKFARPRHKEEKQKFSGYGAYKEILEKQIPAIKTVLAEKIGPATLTTLRGKTAIGVAVGSAYEFLPTAVRIIVPRQVFIDFCVENIDRILPKESKPKKETKKASKNIKNA